MLQRGIVSNSQMHYNGLSFLGIDTLKYIIKILNDSYISHIDPLDRSKTGPVVIINLFNFFCHFIVNRNVYLTFP